MRYSVLHKHCRVLSRLFPTGRSGIVKNLVIVTVIEEIGKLYNHRKHQFE